jgi:hypothetical protein
MILIQLKTSSVTIKIKMKPLLRSHTPWQAPQADTQAKACQRVRLSNRTEDSQINDRKEQRRHNSTYKKLVVQ